MWLAIAAIPVLLLVLLHRKINTQSKKLLQVFSIPFFIIIAIYSLIIAIAVIIAVALGVLALKYFYKRKIKQNYIDYNSL